ncbi:isocitrate lyase/phosphoenolpyruvate mutase family protein [Pseudoalteromonas rubra]|uniref:Isocitrate lyase/phosphoenolpyruvate mutase family protein n=1 Tax=Pseudoalteromonas rubra TaxID=43658 RepID=A0A5S3WKA6_9GAMM|nr:isocitrate lyase/phosphoenolpyruvate mutase family protein [Pseudoalteromonas rubra]TMP27603.1 isocitrate lyase/phosphoenolpyruvate mutase family protein [Pseudoalteromonas rubra]TMP28914.1 isocitrate lyase/phosphoenolpyruvate mutase family protein [Pseudoalteromonas rubra]
MQHFTQLHQQTTPLLLANVWDAASAKAAQQAGYQAIGTSSAAVASVLGYEDGEQLPFDELHFMVSRIASVTSLPLSVDIEAGYSRDPLQIAKHIQQLAQLGVVGVNLEDSLVGSTRTLTHAGEFAECLASVRSHLITQQTDIFINVRCDAFLLGLENAREEALHRAQQYQQAGADGLFLPCIVKPADIQAITHACALPLNVMAMPDLPDINTLAGLGVKRISMGNFAFEGMHTHLNTALEQIRLQGNCAPLFS